MAYIATHNHVTFSDGIKNFNLSGFIAQDRTFLFCKSSSTSLTPVNPPVYTTTVAFDNYTHITARRGTPGGEAVLDYTTISCDDSEFVIADRGYLTMTGVSHTVMFPSGLPKDALLVTVNTRMIDAATTRADDAKSEHVTAELIIDPLNPSMAIGVEFKREVGSTPVDTIVAYEVVLFSLSAAKVTQVTGTINGNSVTVGGPMPDYDKKFVYMTARHESNGLEQCSLRVKLSANGIEINRENPLHTYKSHFSCFVVELFGIQEVDHLSLPAQANDNIISLNNPIGYEATIVTNSCGGEGTGFARNKWTHDETSGLYLFERANTGQPCTLDLQRIKF